MTTEEKHTHVVLGCTARSELSNEALTWAFQQEIPGSPKFVLVVLADCADEEHMCFPSKRRIADYTGQDERTVQRNLKILEEVGAIKVTPWFVKGRQTSNRYILAVGRQIDSPSRGETSAPPSRETSAPPQEPSVKNPQRLETRVPSERAARKRTSIQSEPDDSVQHTFESDYQPRQKRTTKSSGDQGGFAAHEDARPSVPHDTTTAMGLARYFRDEAFLAKWGVMDGINVRSVSGALARWKRAGVDMVTVKAMVDVFIREYPKRWQKNSKAPAWKVFLARREEIAFLATKQLAGQRGEKHRFDKDYWIGLPDDE